MLAEAMTNRAKSNLRYLRIPGKPPALIFEREAVCIMTTKHKYTSKKVRRDDN